MAVGALVGGALFLGRRAHSRLATIFALAAHRGLSSTLYQTRQNHLDFALTVCRSPVLPLEYTHPSPSSIFTSRQTEMVSPRVLRQSHARSVITPVPLLVGAVPRCRFRLNEEPRATQTILALSLCDGGDGDGNNSYNPLYIAA